jgi:hypothetical protein
MAARRRRWLPRRAITALALTSAIGTGMVFAAAVGTLSTASPVVGFDPFNASRMTVAPTRLVPSKGIATLTRPTVRDPFRPPTRSPFIP